MGVPLYEASIKCDWGAAKAIFEKKPELVKFSITENGETALHVAASAKLSKGEVFVKNLVGLMNEKDLALENENFNTALHLAAITGNLATVKIMVEKNRNLLSIPGAEKMLPLHVAALFGKYNVVRYLYKNSNDLCDADGWNDTNRGQLLEKCVANDMFDIALKIVQKYPALGSGKELAILARKPGAFHETQSTVMGGVFNLGKYIYSVCGSKVKAPENKSIALQLLRIIWENISKKPKNEIDDILKGPPDSNKKEKSAPGSVIQGFILSHIEEVSDTVPKKRNTSTLKKYILDSLLSLHVKTQKVIKGSQNHQSLELQKLISEHIVNLHEEIPKIIEITVTENREVQLQRLKKVILDHIETLKKESQMLKETYSSRVAFIAAEMGNTVFLIELIRKYPDLIWKVNDKNQTIFHIAVEHRKAGIYNLLYEIGAMKDMITPLRDPNENNMLHLVGKRANEDQLKDVSGVAFQVQRELLWFKEVKKMIPPSYRIQKNKDGLTPHELFTSEHKDLVSKGEKWMKGTASQCMVVATLIATIVFAAAFTVPGGYKQDNGMPVFHSEATFIAFVVADAISLFSSTASILIFLAILTSRYTEGDFLESLPKKLIFGLVTLFLSITTMTIAFSVTFFVLYNKGLLWIPILIGVFAVLPVILYMFFQYSLFFYVIQSTYGSTYLFNPKKRVLYYSNPKV